MALTADQLNTIYQNVLFRPVDTAGIQFFANRSDISDAQVRQQIELSPEASTFVSPIVRLYQEVLGRVPDQGGLKFFSTQLRAGQSLDNIAQQLINSSEFAAKSTATSGAVDATDLSNTNQLVSDAFQSILGRAPASSEFQFFTGKSAAQILSAVAGSAEAAQTNAAATVGFLDSVAQGTYPTGTLNNQTGGASGGTNAGTNFALTTGTDNVVGTAGNDTVTALVDFTTTTNTTISAADTINGGGGTQDILSITTNGTVGNTNSLTNGAVISNIEGIQIRNTSAAGGANAATVDASQTPGLTFFNANLSTGDVAVTNASNGLAVGIVGNGIVANGNVSATYANAQTTANVTYANGTTAGNVTIAGAGLTSANVTSIGAANTSGTLTLANTVTSLNINAVTDLTLTGVADTGLTTITASGAATKGVALGTLGNAVTTVNASGLTAGGVTATLDAALTSFKGGQGSDVITTTALTSTTAGIVDGGAGTDVLVVGSTTDVNTAAKGAQYVNFETLRVSGSQDVSLISGITSVQVNAATSAVISNLTATQAGAITVRGDQATNLTLQLANTSGSSDIVGLTLNNPTATTAAPADVDITGLKIAGVESLNISSLGGGTDLTNAATLNSLTFGTGGADVLSNIKIFGTSSLDLDATNTAVAVNIDASGMTGSAALKFAGTLIQGSSVIGTSNADTVTASAVAGTTGQFVTYSLGAGNDTINTTTAALATNTASIKIDGGAGTDVLNLTDAAGSVATLTDNNFQYVTNIETITHAVDGAATSITTGGFFNTNFGSGVTFNLGTTTTGAAQTLDASTYTGVATVNVSNAGTGTSTVSTGSGADVITVNAATSTGAVTVSAGSGNDTITINSGSTTSNGATVTGGLGTDSINFGTTVNTAAANVQHVIVNAGDSAVSSTAADSITNFKLADGALRSGHLDFAGTGTVAANVSGSTVSGFSSAQLTVSITNGIATFQGSSASTLTVDQKAAALQGIVTSGLDTAAFVDTGNTYVFHNDSAGDSLVKLVGVSAGSLVTDLTTTTANALAIS